MVIFHYHDQGEWLILWLNYGYLFNWYIWKMIWRFHNGGIPNWMVYNAKSHLNGWFGGTPIFRKPPYPKQPRYLRKFWVSVDILDICWCLKTCVPNEAMVHRNPKFHHLKGFGKNRCVDHGICQVRASRIRGSEWGLWKRYVREYTTKLRSCTMHPSRVLKFPLEIELKEVQKASAIFGKCHQSHLCPIELQLNFHSLDLNFRNSHSNLF